MKPKDPLSCVPEDGSTDAEECNGHGHTHGNWCHCDDGYVMEPTEPLSCAPEDWSPCETALEGDLVFKTLSLPEGYSLWPMSKTDGALGLNSEDGVIAIQDVYDEVLHTVQHPDATSTFGTTVVRGLRDSDRFVGYYSEDFANFEGAYGFRWIDGTFESFDAITALGFNTSSWSFEDQGITAENARGDMVGYYWDDGPGTYFPFAVIGGNISKLEVPGAKRLIFPWVLADNGVFGGRATFEDFAVGYWVVDGNVTTISPENSTQTSIYGVASSSDDGSPLAFSGYYRLPETDDLEREQQRQAGFITDIDGKWTRIDYPGANSTEIVGMSDRCAMVGNFMSDDGEYTAFMVTPRNPLAKVEPAGTNGPNTTLTDPSAGSIFYPNAVGLVVVLVSFLLLG